MINVDCVMCHNNLSSKSKSFKTLVSFASISNKLKFSTKFSPFYSLCSIVHIHNIDNISNCLNARLSRLHALVMMMMLRRKTNIWGLVNNDINTSTESHNRRDRINKNRHPTYIFSFLQSNTRLAIIYIYLLLTS